MNTFQSAFRLSVLGLCLVFCLPVFSQPNSLSQEDRIKAAFLYKFCHYIKWPEIALGGANEPIEIAVVGASDIAHELQQVTEGQTIKGRVITVEIYTPETLPKQPHLLFIGAVAAERHPDWLNTFKDQPVLVVTESPNGLDQGSGINFLADGGRIRFDISLPAIESHQLQVSSQLLTVARYIRGEMK